MSIRPVLAVGFALLLAAVAFILLQSAPRIADSNGVPEIEEAVKLGSGGGRHCQTARPSRATVAPSGC